MNQDSDSSRSLELLFRLEWLLRVRQVQHLRGHSPVALAHQGQGRVLSLLKLKPEVSQKELSTILDIRSQSLGELLAKLERQGLIARSPSPEDRRSMIVSLTDAGRAASEEQVEGPDFDGLFDCLTADEQGGFAAALEKLVAHLEAELGPEGTLTREAFGPPPGDPGFGRDGARMAFEGHGGPGGFGGPGGLGGFGGFGGFGRFPGRGPGARPDFDPRRGMDPRRGFGPRSGLGPHRGPGPQGEPGPDEV